jgi:glutathione peroxidase-family protein
VTADGKVAKRFESNVNPDAPEFTSAVEQLLN